MELKSSVPANEALLAESKKENQRRERMAPFNQLPLRIMMRVSRYIDLTAQGRWHPLTLLRVQSCRCPIIHHTACF
jgi:hypothetical protein